MKKIYTLLSLFFLGTTPYVESQCNLTIDPGDTTICEGATVDLEAIATYGTVNSLQTTLAAGNAHRGNMFEVVALNNLTIDSIDAHFTGTTDIEIYYKQGTYSGFESNSGAWTLAGTATGVVGNGTGTATPIPININLNINSGQTYAFYVTSTNTAISLDYTDGTTEGVLHSSDANLEFYEGIGLDYPFTNGGSTFSPRVWNGNIYYSIPSNETPSYSWSTTATTSTISVSPTTTTTYTCDVTFSPSGCTTQETVTVTVNPLPTVTANATSTEFCEGDSTQLTGSGASTYSWDNGVVDGDYVTPTSTTTYEVTGTDANGCENTDQVQITVNPIPNVVANASSTDICTDGSVTLTGSGADTYTWSDNVNDGVAFNLAQTDTFYVTGVDANGCEASDSIVITVNDCASVSEMEATQFDIYPVPAQNEITVNVQSAKGTLLLYSLAGQQLIKKEINGTETSIDLSDISEGVYVLTYEVQGKQRSKRIQVIK